MIVLDVFPCCNDEEAVPEQLMFDVLEVLKAMKQTGKLGTVKLLVLYFGAWRIVFGTRRKTVALKNIVREEKAIQGERPVNKYILQYTNKLYRCVVVKVEFSVKSIEAFST